MPEAAAAVAAVAAVPSAAAAAAVAAPGPLGFAAPLGGSSAATAAASPSAAARSRAACVCVCRGAGRHVLMGWTGERGYGTGGTCVENETFQHVSRRVWWHYGKSIDRTHAPRCDQYISVNYACAGSSAEGLGCLAATQCGQRRTEAAAAASSGGLAAAPAAAAPFPAACFDAGAAAEAAAEDLAAGAGAGAAPGGGLGVGGACGGGVQAACASAERPSFNPDPCACSVFQYA